MSPALEFCRAQESWLLDLVERLVRLESPTNDKAAVDRCSEVMATELASHGARLTRVETLTAGNHLRAELGAGERQILLLGHLDTVWPVGQLGRMPVRREDGRLFGPGVLDMKAGVALALLAARAALHLRPPLGLRLVLLLTSDEETGSHTSRALVEAEALASHAVLVFEPALADGSLKTSRKACGQYTLTTRGLAAHAGVSPGTGVSAIGELARQLLLVETLQDLDRGVSVNAGVISGGSRPNVVAETATALIDVRAVTASDCAHVDTWMRSLTPHLAGATVHVDGGFNRPAMERTSGVAALFALAQHAAAECGLSVGEGSTGGGSDANFCAALGVPTLDGLGATGAGAHALHEHVEIAGLVPRAALVAGLLTRLADVKAGHPLFPAAR